MFGFKKAKEPAAPMDLDAVMKKFDRESNTRIWEGAPKIAVNCVLAVFSLYFDMNFKIYPKKSAPAIAIIAILLNAERKQKTVKNNSTKYVIFF